ncbi:PFA4 [Symbiodinium sp. CCMP2456]|nr:PFA4 [Symbiodinium sp. CCMP2456]
MPPLVRPTPFSWLPGCRCSFCSPQPPWPEAGRYPVAWDGPQLYYLPRWCDSCQQWKPPRAHHSKRLGQCVLRMDHYCVITENIIGQRNHGYFVLMVIFGNMGLLYALIFVAKTVHLAWQPYWALYSKFATYAQQRGSYYQWLLMGGHLHVLKALLGYEVPLLLVLTVVSLILLGPLLRHVGLALRGTTVLEDMGHGDAIDLPGTKVLPLRPGDFRQPFWMALQMLLGSRLQWVPSGATTAAVNCPAPQKGVALSPLMAACEYPSDSWAHHAVSGCQKPGRQQEIRPYESGAFGYKLRVPISDGLQDVKEATSELLCGGVSLVATTVAVACAGAAGGFARVVEGGPGPGLRGALLEAPAAAVSHAAGGAGPLGVLAGAFVAGHGSGGAWQESAEESRTQALAEKEALLQSIGTWSSPSPSDIELPLSDLAGLARAVYAEPPRELPGWRCDLACVRDPEEEATQIGSFS